MQATLFPSTANICRDRAGFAAELESFRRALAGQTLVSTSRCVDGLLDLYNVTIDPEARRLIESALSDVRFTQAVRCEQVLHVLASVDEVALVDHALDDR